MRDMVRRDYGTTELSCPKIPEMLLVSDSHWPHDLLKLTQQLQPLRRGQGEVHLVSSACNRDQLYSPFILGVESVILNDPFLLSVSIVYCLFRVKKKEANY